MSAPPTLSAPRTTPFGERITGTRPDLSTRNLQLAFLVAQLGVTRRQAQHLVRVYEAECAAARRVGNDSPELSDEQYLAKLMRQAPGPGRQRKVLPRPWATTSS